MHVLLYTVSMFQVSLGAYFHKLSPFVKNAQKIAPHKYNLQYILHIIYTQYILHILHMFILRIYNMSVQMCLGAFFVR